jgi:hypothetical protein
MIRQQHKHFEETLASNLSIESSAAAAAARQLIMTT